MIKLKGIVQNQIIVYLISRYATYALQFATSLLIAVKLGPYYMGVWGTIQLILQYLQQLHFGLGNSFNILYVQNKNNNAECDNYLANSLMLVFYLSCVVLALSCIYYFGDFKFFSKYGIDKYVLIIGLSAFFQYFYGFLVNLYRVKNKLTVVTVCQITVVVLQFLVSLCFSGESLVFGLLLATLLGNFFSTVISGFIKVLPSFNNCCYSTNYKIIILKKGLTLFLYNTSFFFILLSTRTLVSFNYKVDEFGIFTFSFTLAHAFLLLIESLLFVVFPKIIDKFSNQNTESVISSIERFRTCYITSAHVLVYVAMCSFPLFPYILPKYENATLAMDLISLTILVNTSSGGFVELLISKNKEIIPAKLAVCAVLINVILALCFIHVFNVSFEYVIFATMIAYAFFAFFAVREGCKVLYPKTVLKSFQMTFPLRLAIPFVVSIVISLASVNYLKFIPLFLLILLNKSQMKEILSVGIKLLKKPNLVNL